MPATSARQLFDRLAKGQAPALVVLLGSDPYWLELCRKHLLERFVPDAAREWAVTRLSAAECELEEVLGRAQSRPMLAPVQLVFVTEAEVWERGDEDGKSKKAPKKSSSESEEDSGSGSGAESEAEAHSSRKAKSKAGAKSALEHSIAALAAYLEDPAPFTVLIFEVEKLDQRTRFARLLGDHALIVQLDATDVDPAQLAMEMARGLGVTLEPAAAARVAESTGGRAARMAIELEKLTCHVGDRKRITASEVRDLVVTEGNAEVWELADLFAAGKRGRALELVDELLRKGETAPRLVGALAWMYRKLMVACELPRRATQWEAAKALGMRPESALAAVAQAHRLSQAKLRDSLMALAEADDRLKSRSRDDRATMEFLVARLTSGSKARVSA